MVSIIVRDWNTGELYGHLKAKKLEGILGSKLLAILNYSKDIFDLHEVRYITESGIHRSQSRGNVVLNKPHNCDMENFEPDFMEVIMNDGSVQITDIKLDITVYPRGYVLNVGKPIVNIFGTSSPAYLQYIVRSKASRTSLANCHVFPTVQ
ncbi:MAG: hypothetical protein Q4P20_13470, partial [Eubacteriales bacterium]|nr:hypothetical protein [Eubacteriales bacterium]